jgi:site-specific DNA-methyltransferase (adenine-specific)
MAKSITKRTLAGFRNTRVNAQYYPNLIENISERPEAVVNTFRDGKHFWHINDNQNMKLDAIVGNPPYQVMDGGNGASATPVYNLFVDISKKTMPDYISMIMPSRWMTGGRGLDSFRDRMLHDERICVLHDFYQANDCFPNVEIKGGICYFLWDKTHHGNCLVASHHNGTIRQNNRPLLEDGVETFIRSDEQISILYKVKAKDEKPLSLWLNAGRYYGFHTKVEWDDDLHGRIQTADGSDFIPVLSKPASGKEVKIYIHGGECWIKRSDIPKNADSVDGYKVLLPRSGNPNSIIIGKPKISEPGSCSSNTYVVALCPERNLSKDEANNLFNYIKTKFFRLLVATKTTTQSMSLPAYTFVPLQDFTKPWTDEELYRKYNLTDDEIAFIESMIKPME